MRTPSKSCFENRRVPGDQANGWTILPRGNPHHGGSDAQAATTANAPSELKPQSSRGSSELVGRGNSLSLFGSPRARSRGRKPPFEVVGEKRGPEEIVGLGRRLCLARLARCLGPVLGIVIAPAEPGEGEPIPPARRCLVRRSRCAAPGPWIVR